MSLLWLSSVTEEVRKWGGCVCVLVCVCRSGQAIYHVVEVVRLKERWRGLEGEREIGLSWLPVFAGNSLTPCCRLVPYAFVYLLVCVCVCVSVTALMSHTIHSRIPSDGRETQAFQRKCLSVSTRETGQCHLPQPPRSCTGQHTQLFALINTAFKYAFYSYSAYVLIPRVPC